MKIISIISGASISLALTFILINGCKHPAEKTTTKSAFDINTLQECRSGILKVTCNSGAIEFRTSHDLESDNVCRALRMEATQTTLIIPKRDASDASFYRKENCLLRKGDSLRLTRVAETYEGKRWVTVWDRSCGYGDALVWSDHVKVYLEDKDNTRGSTWSELEVLDAYPGDIGDPSSYRANRNTSPHKSTFDNYRVVSCFDGPSSPDGGGNTHPSDPSHFTDPSWFDPDNEPDFPTDSSWF